VPRSSAANEIDKFRRLMFAPGLRTRHRIGEA